MKKSDSNDSTQREHRTLKPIRPTDLTPFFDEYMLKSSSTRSTPKQRQTQVQKFKIIKKALSTANNFT